MNLDTEIELLVLCRGIMAGCISVSVSPSNFLGWAALINGFIGGLVFVYSLKMFHIFELDDAT